MSHKEEQLESKLAEQGFSVAEGERIHDRLVEALGDETSFFDNLKHFLGTDHDAMSLEFGSVLWPEFSFKATPDSDRRLESARYRHVKDTEHQVDSPTDVPLWSMDLAEFTNYFGPLTFCGQFPLSHPDFPAYEEHMFDWSKWRYNAGFSWGLFTVAAQHWD